jgi:glycine cleavage system aminomethyltransferase T
LAQPERLTCHTITSLAGVAQSGTIAPQGCQFSDIHYCRYTGEDGFEISVPRRHTIAFVEKLLRNKRVRLAGLGARDALRLEVGCSSWLMLNETKMLQSLNRL